MSLPRGGSSVYSGASYGAGGGIIGSRSVVMSGMSGGGTESLYGHGAGATAVFPSWSGSALGPGGSNALGSTSGGYRWVLRCLRRGVNPASLDWESVVFQVLSAVRAPAAGYRMTMLRKQTKNVWARDDPGVILVALAASAIAALLWAFADGVWFPPDLLLLVARGWLQLGVAVGIVMGLTRFRRESLTRPRTAPLPHLIAPLLEWAYVAEVAVNAYFPFLLCVHGGLLVTAPMSLAPGLLGTACGNALLGLGTVLFWNNVFRGFVGESWGGGRRAKRARAQIAKGVKGGESSETDCEAQEGGECSNPQAGVRLGRSPAS